MGAMSLSTSLCPAAWSRAAGARPMFPPPDDALSGTFEGTRYDRQQRAIVLMGEPGAYVQKGVFTSAPFALAPDVLTELLWRPRWTTPTQWDRCSDNPVLKPTVGGWDDTTVTTCSVVSVGDQLKMFYGARDRGVGLAVASRHHIDIWDKRSRPVLQAGASGAFDAGGVLSPAVVAVSDDLWLMYYVGYDPTRMHGPVKQHQIGLAKSSDRGETWTRVGTEPVLAIGPPGSCDGATISSSCVLRVGQSWYSWYTGISQVPYLASVCLATSADGIHWRKYPHNPVLSYNPYVHTDAFMVASPQVLHEEGVFKMWYNGMGYGAGEQPGEYSIGYAESLDGIQWERCPRRPVFAASGLGWDASMVEYPEVLQIDGKYELWYCGDGYGNIGRATGRALTSAVVESRGGRSPRPDAGWSDWVEHQPPASPLQSGVRYLQIRVRLRSDDRMVTPMVQHLAVLPAGPDN